MPNQPKPEPQGCDRCGSLDRRQSVADLEGNRHLFCRGCLREWSVVRRRVVDVALREFASTTTGKAPEPDPAPVEAES